ncbi:50S ribosomal protein L21 [Bacilli bacterium]|nr:50S ribosomal protein L21 [Bacilli bacterium]
MVAIFKTGGKQYKVSQNDIIFVEKLNNKEGETIEFNEVLMLDNEIGAPFISGAKVICEIQKQGKQKKINIIHHLPQKHHTRKYGHRQPYTKLIVKEIKK